MFSSLKKIITLTTLSVVLLSGCSTQNLNVSSEIKEPSLEKQVDFTDNTEISDSEIKAIKDLEAKFSDRLNSIDNAGSFNIKTADQGKDVDIAMLLWNPSASKRAKFWGIKDANKLLNAGRSPFKRWMLARKLGGLFPSEAFKRQVLFWVERADLLRISKVSLDDSYLLVMAGVTSLPHLALFNNPIDQAALKVQLSILAFQYGLPIPSSSKVSSWTQEAHNHPPVLY